MRKNFRVFIIMVLIAVIAFGSGAYAEGLRTNITVIEAKDVYLNYNGDEFIARDVNDNVVYPLMHNGTTYLPVRAVASIAGLNVDWDGNTRTVLLTSSDYVNVDDDGYIEELEINDIKADAHLIPDIANGKFKGRVGETLSTGKDITDLFKFELNENGVFGFEIVGNKSASVNVVVRNDENGYDEIAFLPGADDNGMYKARLALTAGIYYLELDGSSEEMPYKITTTFTATPNDYEDDYFESDAKIFKFNGSQYVNQGAVGAGNDHYNDYIILENVNSKTFDLDFDWKGTQYDYVYVNLYDADGGYIDAQTLSTQSSFTDQFISQSINGQYNQVIDKIVINVIPYVVNNHCTEYTVTLTK
ncbi:MAG: hypothetical protein JXQ26_02510 [Tissierellales bacterium]|nr:hypothetical protein [Tissierellales bacterium]MBN2826829.1 hypothetical protein [Tissierellales bacterium]